MSLYSDVSIYIPFDSLFSESQEKDFLKSNTKFDAQKYPYDDDVSDVVSKGTWLSLAESLNESLKEVETEQKDNIGELIERLKQQPGLYNIIYAPFFHSIYINLMHSVISGEYAMKDDFSKVLIGVRNTIFNCTNPSSTRDKINSALNFFEELITGGLSKVLKEFINFNTFVEAQIDQTPSLILSSDDVEQYNMMGFEDAMINYSADYSDLRNLNNVFPFFFHELFEMTKIDQNYFFSKKRLYHLLTLNEMIGITDNGNNNHTFADYKGERICRYGLYQPLVEMTEPNSKEVKEIFNLITLKNNILIYKILQSCSDNTTDLTYIGLDAKYVFDPRRCADKQPEKDFVRLRKPNDYIPKWENKEKIDNKLLELFKEYKSENAPQKSNTPLREYEKIYFQARSENDYQSFHNYYLSAIEPHTEATNKDIRHYNTKILEMARDAVCDTAELRSWVKLHKNDFNEVQGLYQVKKVVNYFLRFHTSKVCYDSELLVLYIRWCLDLLETVEKKSVTDNPDHINRSKQIEEVLLLTDTLLSHLKKLIQSIETNTYCVPYASKFRGCVWHIEEDDSNHKIVFNRIFNDDNDNESFVNFIQGNDTNNNIKRNRIIFIASTYVPPVNYEQLFTDYRTLKFRAWALRSEIHAEYFNRIREYIKEDSEKQLDDNKKTVIQILGIFAALLALTTVALNGINSSHTPRFFVLVMFAFALCIGLFLLLLHFLTQHHSLNQIEYKTKLKIQNVSESLQNLDSEIDIFEKGILKNLINDCPEKSGRRHNSKQKKSHLKREVQKRSNKLRKKSYLLHRRQQDILVKSFINKIIHPVSWVLIGMLIVAALAYYVFKNADTIDTQHSSEHSTQIKYTNEHIFYH